MIPRGPRSNRAAVGRLLQRRQRDPADLSKSNPYFNKLYSSLSSYRNESLAWMQVAELSFDSFMMRMRTRT